ncbi:MAG: hypothetical protein WCK29_00365 [archaeon]
MSGRTLVHADQNSLRTYAPIPIVNPLSGQVVMVIPVLDISGKADFSSAYHDHIEQSAANELLGRYL